MRQSLDRFVSHLPQRVEKLLTTLREGDMGQLRTALHQLKGAAGGYGFPPISEAAGKAEERVKAAEALDTIARDVESLVALVQSVRGYTADAQPVAETSLPPIPLA